ncbi:hypothetical protein GZL_04400 [Streptomyces sp. 769]|nr:hypothetical protein GZL_04400 [Streptomyces sp. 769]
MVPVLSGQPEEAVGPERLFLGGMRIAQPGDQRPIVVEVVDEDMEIRARYPAP